MANPQCTANARPLAKQLIGLGIAVVAMLGVAFTDYRKLINFAPAIYGVGLLLLILVVIPGIGLKINGHRSWIKVPGLGQFQPSEFVKVTTALMLARYFSKPRQNALCTRNNHRWGDIDCPRRSHHART
jgi:rod shape determining protein RodA